MMRALEALAWIAGAILVPVLLLKLALYRRKDRVPKRDGERNNPVAGVPIGQYDPAKGQRR